MDHNMFTLSENGAIMHGTSGHYLLDLNFNISSYRKRTEDELRKDFGLAMNEDEELAVKWLFYAGDVREGIGERRAFRILLPNVIAKYPHLVKYVGEFNRFDSLLVLLDDVRTRYTAIEFIKKQIHEDLDNIKADKHVSLLGKWLPSINATSKKTRGYALVLSKALFDSHRTYRKICTKLRKAIDVVETRMCDKKWSSINYSAVPSVAGFRHREAFKRHDTARYAEFIAKALNGKVKMNAGNVGVGEAVHQYDIRLGWRSNAMKKLDLEVEAVWKNFPDLFKDSDNDFLPVCDCSGSMTTSISDKSSVTCMDVALGLSIYCARHNKCAAFKDKMMAFCDSPYLFTLEGDTLWEALATVLQQNLGLDTNIERVMDEYLDTLVKMNVAKDAKLPALIIFSDMEFNGAMGHSADDTTLFGHIRQRFALEGYRLPRIVFWNLAGRTGSVPMRTNANGVILASGFSQNNLDIIFSKENDPYKVLIEKLTSERYACITI